MLFLSSQHLTYLVVIQNECFSGELTKVNWPSFLLVIAKECVFLSQEVGNLCPAVRQNTKFMIAFLDNKKTSGLTEKGV